MMNDVEMKGIFLQAAQIHTGGRVYKMPKFVHEDPFKDCVGVAPMKGPTGFTVHPKYKEWYPNK